MFLELCEGVCVWGSGDHGDKGVMGTLHMSWVCLCARVGGWNQEDKGDLGNHAYVP